MKKMIKLTNKITKWSIFSYIAMAICVGVSLCIFSIEKSLITKAIYIFIAEYIAALSIYCAAQNVLKGLSYLTNADVFKAMNQTKYIESSKLEFIHANKSYAISFIVFTLLHIYLILYSVALTGMGRWWFTDGWLNQIHKILYTVTFFWLPCFLNFKIATKDVKKVSDKTKEYLKMEKDRHEKG